MTANDFCELIQFRKTIYWTLNIPDIYNVKEPFGCIELLVSSKNGGILPFTTGSQINIMITFKTHSILIDVFYVR